MVEEVWELTEGGANDMSHSERIRSLGPPSGFEKYTQREKEKRIEEKKGPAFSGETILISILRRRGDLLSKLKGFFTKERSKIPRVLAEELRVNEAFEGETWPAMNSRGKT